MSSLKSNKAAIPLICAFSFMLVATPQQAFSQAAETAHQHAQAHQHESNKDGAEYYCPMHPEVTSHEPGRCPECKMFLVKDEVTDEQTEKTSTSATVENYYCPMHPEITSHEPGRCPECKMFLVKEEEEESQVDEQNVHQHASEQSQADKLLSQPKPTLVPAAQSNNEIGRASCRERV